MSTIRVLLADESPHAQRMGQFILRGEGYEVVSVTDGQTAARRLDDFAPDVILADVALQGLSGYELCLEARKRPGLRHARFILTASPTADVDEARAREVGSDGLVRKPFEASALIQIVKPMASSAVHAREALAVQEAARPAPPPPPEPERIDPAALRAAVSIALDAAFPALVDDVTARVLAALKAARAPKAE
ncbi:MAG: response regulator [Acidobacteria bacterium]|nr:response regulator [Acidobacteriota bacterium]